MNIQHLVHLRCPKSKRPLKLKQEEIFEGRIRSGFLEEPVSKTTYPIINFIPRFVPEDNYATSFGIEWNKHNRTQYDKSSGNDISKKRYEEQTKWGYQLQGKIILEAGSGSGRFTEHLVKTGATCISFDYSNAVDANYKSNGNNNNLLIVQASIYEMPFETEYFDRVLCIGVLQHTPDPRLSLTKLVDMVKKGGSICTDIYLKSLGKYYLTPKYLVRHFIKKMDAEKLYQWTVNYVNFMWPLAKQLMKIPKIGKMINWRLMIADYKYLLPGADEETLKQWAILDSYDMISPAHDHPATLQQFKSWHKALPLKDLEIHYGYNGIEARAVKQ